MAGLGNDIWKDRQWGYVARLPLEGADSLGEELNKNEVNFCCSPNLQNTFVSVVLVFSKLEMR